MPAGGCAALDTANEPGYGDVSTKLEGVVQAAMPLKVVLRYLSASGLRSSGGTAVRAQPVSSQDLEEALRAIDAAVLQLAKASIRSVSEDYATFVAAVNELVRLAEEVMEQGVEKRPSDDAGAAWKLFGA